MEGGINTYGYVMGNPLLLIDSYGLKCSPCPPGTSTSSTCVICDGAPDDKGPFDQWCANGSCAVYPPSTNSQTTTCCDSSNWDFYGQAGGQGSIHFLAVGGSVTGGGVIGTGGQACRFVTTCRRLGPGIYGGAGYGIGGGLVRGNTSGMGGFSCGAGGDFGAGPSVGGSVSLGLSDSGISSTGGFKGRGGVGYGFNIGLECCYTSITCSPKCQ